ncbi:MAG: Fic family protein [Bifidobacteriaceae bacterium]|jgi:fido (protein-threonine AMPylation protein)|nr:Fic family protein [Bifidobacteriaceae bacterium]
MKLEELLNYWTAAQPLKPDVKRRMDQQFMIDFNYNSNHLEGNTLTYGQTRLLLLFGKVEGEGNIRDFEEMKASNVGLKLIQQESGNSDFSLTEGFIRDLNKILLGDDFFKFTPDGQSRYLIHTGVYKTRLNSVITRSGEEFHYALPEETSAMMSELISWFKEEENSHNLSAIELATLFHFRYIRIHPFEDGNGRIARLLVNYILAKYGYPMIAILSADRDAYLEALGKCDAAVGMSPFDGANATIEQVKPLTDYIKNYVVKKLEFAKDLLDGKISEIVETQVEDLYTVQSRLSSLQNLAEPHTTPQNHMKSVESMESMSDENWRKFGASLAQVSKSGVDLAGTIFQNYSAKPFFTLDNLESDLIQSRRTLQRLLKELIDNDIISAEGTTSDRRYKIKS